MTYEEYRKRIKESPEEKFEINRELKHNAGRNYSEDLLGSMLDELYNSRAIAHHRPSPGYSFLYVNQYYPTRRIKPGCKHNDIRTFDASDSDPGCMNTTYTHLVCMDCGELLAVDNEEFSGIKKVSHEVHGISHESLEKSKSLISRIFKRKRSNS